MCTLIVLLVVGYCNKLLQGCELLIVTTYTFTDIIFSPFNDPSTLVIQEIKL